MSEVKKVIKKFLSCVVIFTFLFSNFCYGAQADYEITDTTLSTEAISNSVPFTDENGVIASQMKTDAVLLGVIDRIAAHYLRDNKSGEQLIAAFKEEFGPVPDMLGGESWTITKWWMDGASRAVFVKYRTAGISYIARITEKAGEKDSDGSFSVSIEEDNGQYPAPQNDIKGANSPDSNPVIDKLIKDDRIVELYLDSETDTLKACRVNWVEGYIPGITPDELYRGLEIPVSELFSGEQRRNLEAWMRDEKHKVRGAPVRFRIALGAAALGWTGDIDHANVCHAGVRDRAIYIGGLLLKEILLDSMADKRIEILDKDEFRHLKGLDHGNAEEYQNRLDMVKPLIEELNVLKEAILARKTKVVLKSLRSALDEASRNLSELLHFLAVCNEVCLSQIKYPVEVEYPVKKAVALLSSAEQEKLKNILLSPEAVEYRDQTTVDNILLMLNGASVRKDWVKVHSPELINRSLWVVSPEIWEEGGGLGRVTQGHVSGMKKLIGDENVRLRTLEPHYQCRVDANNKPEDLDYSANITYPLKDLKEMDRFSITVGQREVTVVASRGVNEMGVEVNLIKDIQADGTSYFTYSLYNYQGGQYDGTKKLPSWEEFSTFFSKASVEYIRRTEARERKELGDKWAPPVVHANDSQSALVPIYLKILADREKKKKEWDPAYEMDPVVTEAVRFFTTHTYRNRRHYNLRGVSKNVKSDEYIHDVMRLMEIPEEYWEFFMHYSPEQIYSKRTGEIIGNKYCVDMASGALRLSDGQSFVARAHLMDLASWDEWANNPGQDMEEYYRRYGIGLYMRAISNGDARVRSSGVFREIMKKKYGESVDIEHPDPDKFFEVKKEGKKNFYLPENKYYSSDPKPEEGDPILNSDQLVVAYSGRLVPEKVGRQSAFTDSNIRALLEKGVQVVIFGNVQPNNGESEKLAEQFIALTQSLKGKDYKGKFIFVPRFSLNQQRMLFAAQDVQVTPSFERTEAAGVTELNAMSCGAIQVPPSRKDNGGIGEGLLEAQGEPVNWDSRGEGNTLAPKSNKPEDYLSVLLQANARYNIGELKYYQATSIKLSRILEALLTSAQYLREFSYTLRRKNARLKTMKIKEEMDKVKMKENSLFNQVITPDPVRQPIAYGIFKISNLAMNGRTEEALEKFFTNAMFQDADNKMDLACEVLNDLIGIFIMDKSKRGYIMDFMRGLIRNSLELSENEKGCVLAARNIQLMAGQSLSVISWIDSGVKGAERLRLTTAREDMIRNEEKGDSFLKRATLPKDLNGENAEVKEEGKPGFYWRGIEDITKLGDNIVKELITDEKTFASAKDKLVMYLMDHGMTRVPDGIKAATEEGRISTLHFTSFINDVIPGSLQTTSTGAGHFQADKLDIKQIATGRGVQVNVLFSEDGKTVKQVIAHEVSEGDWCLALPGYVDYMINLGGLSFYDISVKVSADTARKFNPHVDFRDKDKLDAFSKAVKKNAKYAPYTGVRLEKAGRPVPVVVKTMKDSPDAVWMDGIYRVFKEVTKGRNLAEIYKGFTEEKTFDAFAAELAGYHKVPSVVQPSVLGLINSVAEIDTADNKKGVERASLGKKGIEGINTFVNDNTDFLRETLGRKAVDNKLIRISVDALAAHAEDDNFKAFLSLVQSEAVPHAFIEIFSPEPLSEVALSEYERFGIEKKDLPEDLKEERRTRANTVTILPVLKDDRFATGGNKRNNSWEIGDIDPENTIIAPVGFNYDKTGIIRSIVLGLRLSEIAKNDEEYVADSDFVAATLAQYIDFCRSQGQDMKLFNLTKEDLVNLATGARSVMVESLNKLIKLLPIRPVNMDELRDIFENARKALIAA
ncbi:MAG: glycogen/starch synthase [Candidatus Omnitrophota bacterium]